MSSLYMNALKGFSTMFNAMKYYMSQTRSSLLMSPSVMVNTIRGDNKLIKQKKSGT